MRTCVVVACALLSAAVPLAAQASKPQEYQVKAVYLYNFGKFVVWPGDTAQEGTFEICVIGRDPFGASLEATIAGDTINHQKLEVKRISNAREAAGCRILFISDSESGRVREVLSAFSKLQTLTVSDMPGFLDQGGMIQFVLKDHKVRFSVNLAASEKAGLVFSSQLLKVAIEIRKAPEGGQ